MSKDTSSNDYLELKTELRSILISSQEGCTEQQLLKEYAAYNGQREIPFRQMGYKDLNELLKSMPDVARIDTRRGYLVIHGVSDENTAHIKEFVMQQKKTKKSAHTRAMAFRNIAYNRPNGPSMYRGTRKVSPYQRDNHYGDLLIFSRAHRIRPIMEYHFNLSTI